MNQPVLLTAVLAMCASLAGAQSADRVLTPVNPAEVAILAGHHPSWATPQADAGALPPDVRLEHLTLLLARSSEAQQAFEQFLQNQQDPASGDYHHWLTSIEIGERFGVSQRDIAALTEWLLFQGLRVDAVSDSRIRISFSGSASAVGNAFGAEVHYFLVNGKKRISITAPPQIPAALAPVIKIIHGLYTIESHPAHQASVARFLRDGITPNYTPSFPGNQQYIVPADFSVIYDLPSASSRITGANTSIAVIARSRVYNADIENFQSLTGLATKDPTVIIPPGGIDPGPPETAPPSNGIASSDQAEATLDITRAGSVAPDATIDLVASGSTATTDGIEVAAQYVVDSAPVLAHVMSLGFSLCEADAGGEGVTFWDNLFSQASAEGISVLVASGDSGAAGCDSSFQAPPSSQFLNTNAFCSSSYVTCVGGTEFADASNPSQYWAPTNGPTLGSALSYIPEGAWNEPLIGSNTQAASSGGGVSAYIPPPAWQTGTGLPAMPTGRYTPDVAFSASAHDGYLGCFAAGGADCSFFFYVLSGTSAAAADMAGITALLNQKLGPQGNLNPTLYKLAATSSNVFHDVTVVSSGVSGCTIDTPSICNNSTPSADNMTGGLAGYQVGTGYDEVTGLGSIDVAELLDKWIISALTVTLTGAGGGTVTSTPSGINCPGTCNRNFPNSTAVVLTAAVLPGSTFGGWNGACSGMGNCTLTLLGSLAVTAAFNPVPGCNFSISPVSQSFSSVGGTGSVDLTAPAGCGWTANSNVSWITITSGNLGSGTSVVTYSVDNNNGLQRSGTITLAGVVFSVSEAAGTQPGPGGDFSLGAASGGSTSATVTAGQAATYNLQVTPLSGFTGSVSLSCGGSPTQTTCSPSPVTVTLSGTSPAFFAVNVTTTAPSSASAGVARFSWPPLWRAPAALDALLLLLMLGMARFLKCGRPILNRPWALAGFLFVSLATLAPVSGCGGTTSAPPPVLPSGGTQPGTYTLMVTGTQQGISHSLSLTLTVK